MTGETVRETRPLYWSVRRELWENRSIYLAPLIVAGVFLFGFLISLFTLPRRIGAVQALGAGKQREAITMPYSAVAGLLIMTAFIVAVFYCLDALRGERRDRSILFWKSLPVSDRTTVLSKAGIPLVVLPLLVFTLAVTVQCVMFLLSTVVLMGTSRGVVTLWTHMKFVQSTLALLYGVIAIALWHAPLYAWLLLVSGWTRRAAVLWALLPPLAVAAVEKIFFNTSYVGQLLGYRVIGWFKQAFVFPQDHSVVMDPLAHLTPGRFLGTPGLWIGLAFTAAFLAAAVRLRRKREPI